MLLFPPGNWFFFNIIYIHICIVYCSTITLNYFWNLFVGLRQFGFGHLTRYDYDRKGLSLIEWLNNEWTWHKLHANTIKTHFRHDYWIGHKNFSSSVRNIFRNKEFYLILHSWINYIILFDKFFTAIRDNENSQSHQRCSDY